VLMRGVLHESRDKTQTPLPAGEGRRCRCMTVLARSPPQQGFAPPNKEEDAKECEDERGQCHEERKLHENIDLSSRSGPGAVVSIGCQSRAISSAIARPTSDVDDTWAPLAAKSAVTTPLSTVDQTARSTARASCSRPRE
jgi:hypothetical protein